MRVNSGVESCKMDFKDAQNSSNRLVKKRDIPGQDKKRTVNISRK